MYHVASYYVVPPEHHREFIRAALEDGRDSAANEAGTKRFELIRDEENGNRFYLNEAYADEAAFERHTDGPYFKRFFGIIDRFVEKGAGGRGDLIKGTRIDDDAPSQ